MMEKQLFIESFQYTYPCQCSEGAELFWAQEEKEASYKAFLEKLVKNGFLPYAQNTVGSNLFATYVKGERIVNVYYTPCDRKVRMVSEARNALPPRKVDNQYVSRVVPLVTQLQLSNLKVDCGMSYVIRLCDGRFVLIDSAYDEYEETERLLEVLKKQNTVFEKPVIAACIITHSHSDHLGALTRLMRDYKNEVVFGDFIYNWPNPEMTVMSKGTDHQEFDELVRKMQGARIIYARSGQRFYYADAVFDVLFCCDDMYPEFIANYNDSSLITVMTMNGKKVLWMGDGHARAVACLVDRYDANDLKCDILQVTHHGYRGGSTELYQKVDPEALLWPVPDFWYQEVKDWDNNEYFLRSKQLKHIYISGRGEITLNMCEELPKVKSEPRYCEGEIIYEEDFEKERVIELKWSALTGGSTGYAGADLELKSGRCIWKGTETKRTVLEILRPGLLENAVVYEMILSGEVIKEAKEFGVIFNHMHPTQWVDEKFVRFDAQMGQYSIRMTVDEMDQRSGLYFVLKEGIVAFEHVKVIKRGTRT